MKFARAIAFVACVSFVGLATAEDKKATLDPAKLTGNWKITSGKKGGNELTDMAKQGTFVFSKDDISIKNGDNTLFVISYKLDTKTTPVNIDLEITKGPDDGAKGSKAKGIIELNGDEIKLCYPPFGGERPKKFEGAGDYYYFVLTREKKK